MKLEDMKQKTYALIEEYVEDAENLTEDEDLATKMNSVINQVQNELARIKKIPAIETLEGTEGEEIELEEVLENFYQIDHVQGLNATLFGNKLQFNEEGTLKVYYWKYPEQINQDTEDDYEFELSDDALEIMPYGVAGDLLLVDVSNNYGSQLLARYRELKQELDPRYGLGQVYIDGGI